MVSRPGIEEQINVEALARSTGPGRVDLVDDALGSDSLVVRDCAAEIAADLLPISRLVAILAEGPAHRRDAAMHALGLAGRRALPTLLATARDRTSPAALFCIRVVGQLPDGEAAAALRELSQCDDSLLSQAALEAMGGQRDSEAFPLLVRALHADMWRAFAAIDALSRREDPRAAVPLSQLVHDEVLGEAARNALGRLFHLETAT